MATQVQFRRGTTTENNAFTGAIAELTVDTTLTTLRIHDGTTAGGVPVINTSSAQTLTNKTFGNGNTWQANPPTLQYGGTGKALTAVQGGIVYSDSDSLEISLSGTAGQILTSGGTAAPIWVTPSGITVGTASSATTASNILGGSAGYLVYQYDTDDTDFIEPGASGTFLRSTGASTPPDWATASVTFGSTEVDLGQTSTSIAGITAIDGTTGATSFFDTPTGTVSLFGAASAVGIGASTSTTTVNDDLVVQGNLTVNGTTTTINSTTLDVDDLNITVASGAADAAAANGAGLTVDGANATFNYASTGDKWTMNKPLDVTGTVTVSGDTTLASDLAVNGGDITTSATTFNVINDTATTVNAFGAATTIDIGAATGTTSINNNLDVDGDVNIDGGDLTTNQTTFNVVNANATTINFGGAATSIDIGAVTGTTSINNNLDVDGDVNIDGGDLTTNQTTFNVLNTTATTINAFGDASDINIGAATSTVTFADDVEVGGNLDVTGNSTFTGTVTFNGGTINLGDSASDNVSFGADVNSNIIPNTDDTYDLGSASQEWKDLFIDGTATIDTLQVDESATVTADLAVNGGDLTTTAGTFNLINTNATTANIAGAATTVNIGASTGTLTFNNAQTVFDSTDSVQIPVGTTAQRDGTPVAGQIRYNSTLSSFEGYGPGNAWGSLGGVKDVDQDTFLTTETSAGSDEDTFTFTVANTTVATLDSDKLALPVGKINITPLSGHPTHAEGNVYYDSIHKTLSYQSDISDVEHELGIEEHVRVYNNSGATIAKGKPVYWSGNANDYPTIAMANATSSSKYNVQGLTAGSIANNSYGYVIVSGLVDGIDTSSLNAGANFFAGLTDGALQNDAPSYPNFPMCLGWVIKSDATNGIVLVNQQNHSVNSFRVQGDTHIGGDLTVTGDLTVDGTQTTTSSNNVQLGASFQYLNAGDTIGEANTTFSGSGLDDAYFSGHFTGTAATTYYVRIDSVGGGTNGVDTFEWSTDNFATTSGTDIDITGDEQLIHSADNIGINFGATTGHTLNDTWLGTASPSNVDTGMFTNYNTGTSGVGYTHTGLFWDADQAKWVFLSEYDPEPEGTINLSDSSVAYATIKYGRAEVATLATTGNATVGGTLGVTSSLSASSLNVGSGSVTAGSLDISGNADIDGTMEADAYTVNGTALNEYIADTVGAMVGSNTESGISVTYQDADNTLDFDVGDFSITLTGAVTGSGTVTNLGNVSIATTATNDPTITLAGDLSGSATLTNLGNATLTATINANSVALGTDTTGNYMVNVSAGSGVSVSHTQGEGSTATISHADTSSAASVNNSGNTFIQDITLDTFGHITGINSASLSLGTLASLNSVNAATITDNSVGAAELNVSGNGSTSQFLRSDGDGTFTWATPSDTNTTYSAGNGISLSGTTFTVAAGNGLSQTSTGLQMSGSYTGNFAASGNITANSDLRLKSNIEEIGNAIEKVKQVRGVTYDMNGERMTGVIAQELEVVLPEAVITADDEMGTKSVAYGNVVGLLIEAIKDQQKQIDELKKKLGE